MKKSEIEELTDVKLITEFYWAIVRSTNEVNSRRGLTKQTAKEEEWLINELIKRFGVDKELVWKELSK